MEIPSDVRVASTLLLVKTIGLVISFVSNEDPGPLTNHISQVLVGVAGRRAAVWVFGSLCRRQLHSTLIMRQLGLHIKWMNDLLHPNTARG